MSWPTPQSELVAGRSGECMQPVGVLSELTAARRSGECLVQLVSALS